MNDAGVEAGVARLCAVLESEESVYLELRDLLQRERELLARLDAEALLDLAFRKEALADEARLVEESRIAVAAELAAIAGLAEPRPTLSRLCEALGSAGSPLRAAHTRLVVLVGVVRELCNVNAALSGEHLTRVRGTLQLLGRLLPDEATYSVRAAAASPEARGRLVRRSA